jgi:hypothetical protein
MKMQTLIHLIYHCPALSDARIARKAECSAPTVRRYRRLITDNQYPWETLCHASNAELYARFNKPRFRPPKKLPCVDSRVAAFLTAEKATVRDAWEDYRATQPRPHVEYDTFRRYANSLGSWQYVPNSPGVLVTVRTKDGGEGIPEPPACPVPTASSPATDFQMPDLEGDPPPRTDLH